MPRVSLDIDFRCPQIHSRDAPSNDAAKAIKAMHQAGLRLRRKMLGV